MSALSAPPAPVATAPVQLERLRLHKMATEALTAQANKVHSYEGNTGVAEFQVQFLAVVSRCRPSCWPS